MAVLPVSVTTGEGLEELWKLIARHRTTQKNTDQDHTDSGNTGQTEEKR
jgi:putative protein kinase ArgK-like GTPase of G3E family